MRHEQTSTHAQAAIKQLLSVITLASMARSCESDQQAREYLQVAADWLPRIEQSIESIKLDLRYFGVKIPEK